MASHLRTKLVLSLLEMATGQRTSGATVHYSDQGAQCTALKAHDRRWDQLGTATTMRREGFFATLECRPINRVSYATRREACCSIFRYIEG